MVQHMYTLSIVQLLLTRHLYHYIYICGVYVLIYFYLIDRMLEVRNHRISNIVPDNVLVTNLVVMADLQYRIERVPDDEMNINEAKELLVPCAHFSKVLFTEIT